jgi:uncharacterized protein
MGSPDGRAGQSVGCYADAQYALGSMYPIGRGVPQDHVEAYKWFTLAAARFPTSESKQRESVVRLRDAFAAKLPTAQIAEAQRLAREWKPE